MEKIYETVIYDGGMKKFRILNLNSGTFYCLEYDTKEATIKSIEQGEVRGSGVVEYVPISIVYNSVLDIDAESGLN